MPLSYTAQLVSKADQAARTPSGLIALAGALVGLPSGGRFFDPCPSGWTEASGWNGLTGSWREWNFVNPPFDQASAWLQKAEHEAKRGRVSVVLLPCRFGARYAHRALRSRMTRALIVLSGGVRFVGYNAPLPIACCFYVIGPVGKLRLARLPGTTCAFAETPRALSPSALRSAVIAANASSARAWEPDALSRDGRLSPMIKRLLAARRAWITLVPQRLRNAQLLIALRSRRAQVTFVCPALTDYIEPSAVLTNTGATLDVRDAIMHRRRVYFAQPTSEHDERQTKAILSLPK